MHANVSAVRAVSKSIALMKQLGHLGRFFYYVQYDPRFSYPVPSVYALVLVIQTILSAQNSL